MSERLFSRKDRRYWLTVTGGMVLIGIINVVIGYLLWDDPPQPPPPQAFPRPAPVPVPPRADAPRALEPTAHLSPR